MMDDALFAAYESAKDRLNGATFSAFKVMVAGWNVFPLVICGQCAGAVLTNGPDIHACVLPQYKGRWFNKQAKSILENVVKQNGFARTQATTDEGVAFVERLGFVRDGDAYILRCKNGN